jgi:hypothetical protein
VIGSWLFRAAGNPQVVRPLEYRGSRRDDPEARIPHEFRRERRGL